MADKKGISETAMEAESEVSSVVPVRTSDSMERDSRQHINGMTRDGEALQLDELNVVYPTFPKAMLILTGLFMGVFLVALDQTIIGTAIPNITDEFNTIQDVGWYGSAYLLTSTGAGLVTTYSANMSNSRWIGYQVLVGAGLGAGFQVPQAAIQTVLAQEDIPVGSSAVIFFQNLGGAVFISVGQSVFQNGLSTALKKLAPEVDSATVFSAGATGLQRALEDAGQGSFYQTVLRAYLWGLQDTFRVSLGLALGALLATLFVEWKNVKQGHGDDNKADNNHAMMVL
ncbi:hypothetical protein N0V93_007827 [Gnomoniopsis smithogilvyi]|uniref:Uncharacterized protein n=1 Tax=Gnomoniopsis smithogilvyi TaxID=1191159 RepID=A0A9W8YLU5_9PEZI|nr:hypothetical protein N0V93_007827 [Gnomoniopsis smithogilvyi]